MKFGYLVLCLIAFGYVLLKKRKFDFYTIAVLSTIIYYYPAFFGELMIDENHYENILPTVYLCLYLHIIVLIIAIYCQDHFSIKTNNSEDVIAYQQNKHAEYWAVTMVALIGLVMVAYVFTYYGGFQLSFNKMQLLSEYNKFTEYMKYIALFVFCYAFTNRRGKISLLEVSSIILILYTFLLGHRSFVVIGIIYIFVNSMEKNKVEQRLSHSIFKHWKMFLFILISAVFFLFVKNVFAALMSGQYQLVKQRLTNPDYYYYSLMSSESNTIILNLQRVCSGDMSYSFLNYILGVFGLIPILGSRVLGWLEFESFETQLNYNYNARLSEGVGLGSTFLGEAYAIGDFVMVIIIVSILFIVISYWSKCRLRTKSGLMKNWYGIILTYLTFYIHRNSSFFLLMICRSYLYILILCWLFKKLYESFMYRR